MMKKNLFNKNVAQYKDLIFSQAYYFTGNTDDAADVTQDVLLKLWNYQERIEPNAVKSWLLKVTRNLCIDLSRRRNELPASRLGANADEQESLLDQAPDETNPEQIAIQMDLKDKLFQAIQTLPPKIKDAIIMREIHDQKYEDIAAAMDIPVNSVKVYLHRGRKMLFKYLQPYFSQG
ncbi:MAG: RNA polymerase sigma factor [Candidatus Zhuqueibacterota bacterium]